MQGLFCYHFHGVVEGPAGVSSQISSLRQAIWALLP